MKTFLKNILPINNKDDMPIWQLIVKKFLAFWLCFIVGTFVAEGVVILLHFAFGKNPLMGEVLDMQTMTLIKYYGYIIFIGIVLLYWKYIEKKPLADMGVTKKLGNYFIGVALAILLLIASVVIIILIGGFKYKGIFDNINVGVLLLFVGGFVIQGATEELLCRGLVLHALKDKMHISVAIGISTLAFIMPHLSALFAGETIYGIIGIVNLVLISIIFSGLTLRFKSIWAACGLHSIWNAILYVVLGLNLSGNDETVTALFDIQSVGANILNGGVYGIEASIVTTGILLLAAVGLRVHK